jgi:hypothetical protein
MELRVRPSERRTCYPDRPPAICRSYFVVGVGLPQCPQRVKAARGGIRLPRACEQKCAKQSLVDQCLELLAWFGYFEEVRLVSF